jgi:hypothetical protein
MKTERDQLKPSAPCSALLEEYFKLKELRLEVAEAEASTRHTMPRIENNPRTKQ